MKIFNCLLLLLIACSSCGVSSQSSRPTKFYSSSADVPLNREPGKCYAKALMPDQYEVTKSEKAYPVYTGSNEVDNEHVEEISIETSAATSQWVKKKADRNCLSADPNDCLVWCLVEVPAETVLLLVVTDTSMVSDYKMEQPEIKQLTKKGGNNEWMEVMCGDKVNASFIKQLHIVLRGAGYDIAIDEKTIGTSTKAALTQYQRDNNLPVGQLDVETLGKLGLF